MNKSDLKQLIREEIEKASNERFSLKAFKTESELLDAINALPNDIDEVGVPTKLGNWDMMKKIDPEEDQNWKETVKSMLDDLKVDEEEWNEINQFKLCTWTGNVNRGVYIQLSSDATERFAADMGYGKYGKLD